MKNTKWRREGGSRTAPTVSIAALLAAVMFSGCGLIAEVAREDFKRTVELADKYGKPDVKQCFTFLVAALDGLEANQARLDQLLAEDTQGLASLALKLVLIKEAAEGLADPARRAEFEKDFDLRCSKTAGKILIEVFRDARKAAKRLPGVR